MNLILYTSRRQALEEILGGSDLSDSAAASVAAERFLERADGTSWLNPDIDWEAEGRKQLLADLLQREFDQHSHLGGEATPAGEHEGIVRIQAPDDGWEPALQTVGSGVRIGDRLVLTARHVVDGWGPTDIRFSETVANASFSIENVVRSDEGDAAVLVFDDLPNTSEIVPLADTSEITANGRYRSVGFGYRQTAHSTELIKNHLDGIVVYSLDCTGESDASRFLCRPGKELVAGSVKWQNGDEKRGMAFYRDSGGGLLVETDDGWKLAGIVAGDDFDPSLTAARYTRADLIRSELNAKLGDAGHPTF